MIKLTKEQEEDLISWGVKELRSIAAEINAKNSAKRGPPKRKRKPRKRGR